jgi:Bardet-Biedl syndrome 4 protein
MFTKAMILRRQGQINGSLSALEEAIKLDPQNPRNLKEIARSLYLLGKHKIALDVYDEALKKHPHDWELYHDKGLCHVYLKNLPEYDTVVLATKFSASAWSSYL